MLYKYGNLNDANILNNIKNNQLYFNTANNFNDIFDIYGAFKIKDRNYIDKLFASIGISTDIIHNFTDEQLLMYARMLDRIQYNNSKYGITCFSQKSDDILMWALYADKNKGICLGYDANIDDEAHISEIFNCDENKNRFGNLSLREITMKYEKKRPVFEYDENYSIEQLLCTKFIGWEYEKEIRLMLSCSRENSFPSLVTYKQGFLKEVIFGAMVSVEKVLDFVNWIKNLRGSIEIKVCNIDDVEYKYNLVTLRNSQLDKLCTNIEYLLSNTNMFIDKFDLLKTSFNNKSSRCRRKVCQQIIKNIPMYYILSYFDFFLYSDVAYEINREVKENIDQSFKFLIFIQFIDNMNKSLRK